MRARLLGLVHRLVRDESGQDLIEYALLSTSIGFAGVLAWSLISGAIGGTVLELAVRRGQPGCAAGAIGRRFVTLASFAAAIVSFAACLTDLWSRRIPNSLTLGGAVAALLFHGAMSGITGLGMAAAGWAVGLALFLPIFALRGIGGGDVKLVAALGAWLGPMPAVWLAMWTALAGGVFAVIVAGARGYLGRAFQNVWSMLSYWRVMGVRPHPAVTLESAAGPRLPYSLPIAAGLGLTLWLA